MSTLLAIIGGCFAISSIAAFIILAYETKHAILVDENYNIIDKNIK